METKIKVSKKTRISFNKKFANGEQYLYLVPGAEDANIVTDNKEYWWQEQAVYNHILPLVEYAKSKLEWLSDDDIYGENGLVERLMPYQRLYNATMNQRSDRIKYATYGICFVEDGSVDADSLGADGVAPGSVVVYRQGTVEPQLVFDNTVGVGYNSILSDCLEQMRQIAVNFVEVRK